MPGLDQRIAGSAGRVGDARSVGRAAEGDALAVLGARGREGPCGGRRVRLRDRADEAEAAPRHRPDPSLPRAVVADRRARRADAGADRRIGDDPAVPDGADQVVARHDPVALAQEEGQQVEDLRLDRARLSGGQKLAGFRHQCVVAEKIAHVLFYHGAAKPGTGARRLGRKTGQKTGRPQGNGKAAVKRRRRLPARVASTR